MHLVDDGSYNHIKTLIENDIEKCLYIYMDLVNYKKENSPINVYVNDIDDIKIIIVEYHYSFQIYAIDDVSFSEIQDIKELIYTKKPKMISGTANFIETISKILEEMYYIERGAIFIENKFREIDDNGIIERAHGKDAREIAELLTLDSGLGSHYDLDDLEEQIRRRIENHTGRSYIIRDKGKIVAHTATYAECDGMSVVSGTIVHPKYRDNNYYLVLSNYIIKILSNEGKTIYTFTVDPKMYKYHIKMHKMCGTYARLKLNGE